MAKEFCISKALAVGTVVMTMSAVGGIITMAIIYQIQIAAIKPTPPPTTLPTTPIPTGPPPDLRLPRNLVPESYTIFLRPHLYTEVTNETNQTFVFTGNSTVTFLCLKKAGSIFLHSKDLDVKNPVLMRLDKSAILKVKLNFNYSTVNETNFLEVQLDDGKSLEPNVTYSLFTEFEGELLNDLAGFYTSQYEVEKDNETR